jgi:hypothetical protein
LIHHVRKQRQAIEEFKIQGLYENKSKSELLAYKEKIEEEIRQELKEDMRTKIWIDTKERNETEKLTYKSSRSVAKNVIYIGYNRQVMPAFYKMLMNTHLENLRALY